MKKLSLISKFERWRASRASQAELLDQIDALRKENERLKQKLAAVRQAKDQAETHAEDRKREKEALRAKLGSQRKALESHELMVGQLGAKITELRAENDKIKRAKKK